VPGSRGNWKETAARRRRIRRRTRLAERLRSVESFLARVLLLGLVSAGVLATASWGGAPGWTGGPDLWSYWREPASEPVSAQDAIREPGSIVLGLMNVHQAPDARVLLNGRTVGSFDTWSLSFPVRGGDTISIERRASLPLRVRVVSSRGVAAPPEGVEWSVIEPRVLLGNVVLAGTRR